MTRKTALSIPLLSVAYAVLIALVTPYSNYLIKMPDWWYPMFGQNGFSGLLWLHIPSAIFLSACALPIAAIVVRAFPGNWVKVSTLVGVLATAFVLTPAIRLIISDSLYDQPLSSVFLLSMAIDLIKYAGFPLLIAALIQNVVPSSNAPH